MSSSIKTEKPGAADLLDNNVVDLVAHVLHDCEMERGEHCNALLSKASGKDIRGASVEPFEEHADSTWRPDARRALVTVCKWLSGKSPGNSVFDDIRSDVDRYETLLEGRVTKLIATLRAAENEIHFPGSNKAEGIDIAALIREVLEEVEG